MRARFTVRYALQVELFFAELDSQERLRFLQLIELIQATASSRIARPQIGQHGRGFWAAYHVEGNEIQVLEAGFDPLYPRMM